MRDNVIRMQLQDGMLWADEGLFQYDYGQRLILEGIELPPVYEIHFSNSSLEDSKICIGDETGIDIPDEYLQTGAPVLVWLVLHSGQDDGETIYAGRIHVSKRSKPTSETPTPAQQSTLEQAISLLQSALTEIQRLQVATVEETSEIIDEHSEGMNHGD